MTTTEARTFLGMTIVGELNLGSDRKPQRPVEELGPIFSAVFAGGVIDAVRWTQYTPYFNDGDPCTFSASGDSLMIRIAERTLTEDEATELEAGADYGRADDFAKGWIETYTYSDDAPMATLIGTAVYAERANKWNSKPLHWEGPHPELAEAVDVLQGAISGGEFDDALLGLFGDHATIVVPASGDIEVESYDHD